MEDERVDRLLRTLREAPPATAGPSFTPRVLARLDAPRAGASANWLPRLTLPAVALAATFVVAASLLLTSWQPGPARGSAVATGQPPALAPAVQVAPAGASAAADRLRDARVRRMLAELRHEEARLSGDLRRLRRSGGQPVLYVGGDEQVDLIVNLDRVRDLPSRRARAANPGLRPEALSSQTF